MSDTAANPRAVAGGNSPPLKDFFAEINTTLPSYLALDNADLTKRTDELMAAFDRAPDSIADQDAAGRFSDFIAQINACIKNAEGKRVDIKAGPLAAGRTIDGFFQKNILDRLTPAKTALLKRLTVWEQAKAAEERRRREEEARVAEAARQEAERVARLEREKAERERQAAEAAERERLAAIQNEKDLEKAVELEEENKRLAAERAAAQKTADEEAERRRIDADKAAREAAAKAASLHKTSGDVSSSTLATHWVATITDETDLNENLSLIADFIPLEAKQKALNAFMKIHKDKRPVPGVKFAQETEARVRG